MRINLITALLMLTPAFLQAQSTSIVEIAGVSLWDSELIEATANRLEQELGDKKMVYETIGNYPGHSMYLVLRGKTSFAEFHETESDYQISFRGKATLRVGGELVDGESRPRKQQRGSSIDGGKSYSVTPGAIFHVPPAVPHHLVIEPGKPYMYILIKIDEEPITGR